MQKSERSNAEIIWSLLEASLLTFSLSAAAAARRDGAGQRGEGTFVALSISQAAGAPVWTSCQLACRVLVAQIMEYNLYYPYLVASLKLSTYAFSDSSILNYWNFNLIINTITPFKYTSLSFTKRSRSSERCLSANRMESVQFPALSHLAYRGGEKSALSPINRHSDAICGDIYEGNKLKPLHSLSYGTRDSLSHTHTAVVIRADNVERARLNYGARTRKCNLVYSEAVWFSYWLELRLNILGGRFRLALIKSCSESVVSRLFCCRIQLCCLHCHLRRSTSAILTSSQ